MRRRFLVLALGGLSLPAVLATGVTAAPAHGLKPLPAHGQRAVCSAVSAGRARCDSRIVTYPNSARPLATTTYQSGYRPIDLSSAYKWANPTGSTWSSNGQTVAIVDAYDNPNAYSDLSAYRSQFGLPPCTTTSGCFRKVNQSGQASPLPIAKVGWGQEIDLDIEMVSAVCPNCKILLVEANSNYLTDLGAGVNRAVTMGSNAVSNSYGAGEFSGETSYDSYYNHLKVAVTASSGDGGYGVEFPAADNHVVAVGGTSLTRASNSRGWSEAAWSGAGSGCSAYVSQSSWQTAVIPAGTCSRRVVADVSAVADPNTGVAVYDSYGSTGGANWYVFGGTSVASPIVASAFGLAQNAASYNYPASHVYANASHLFDVTSGSNGRCTGNGRFKTPSLAYLCTAEVGYDGPTGLGTPNGTAAF